MKCIGLPAVHLHSFALISSLSLFCLFSLGFFFSFLPQPVGERSFIACFYFVLPVLVLFHSTVALGAHAAPQRKKTHANRDKTETKHELIKKTSPPIWQHKRGKLQIGQDVCLICSCFVLFGCVCWSCSLRATLLFTTWQFSRSLYPKWYIQYIHTYIWYIYIYIYCIYIYNNNNDRDIGIQTLLYRSTPNHSFVLYSILFYFSFPFSFHTWSCIEECWGNVCVCVCRGRVCVSGSCVWTQTGVGILEKSTWPCASTEPASQFPPRRRWAVRQNVLLNR